MSDLDSMGLTGRSPNESGRFEPVHNCATAAPRIGGEPTIGVEITENAFFIRFSALQSRTTNLASLVAALPFGLTLNRDLN